MDSNNIQLNELKNIPNEFLNEVEISEKDFFDSVEKETPIEEKKEDIFSQQNNQEKPKGIFDFENSYDTQNQNLESGSVRASDLINAELATGLVDTVFSSLIITGASLVDVEIKKAEITFDAKERKTLHPVVEKCLEKIKFNFNNPFELLAFVLLVVYGSKLMPYYGKIGSGIANKISGKKTPVRKEKKESKEKEEFSTNIKEPSPYMIEKYGREKAIEKMKNKQKENA